MSTVSRFEMVFMMYQHCGLVFLSQCIDVNGSCFFVETKWLRITTELMALMLDLISERSVVSSDVWKWVSAISE